MIRDAQSSLDRPGRAPTNTADTHINTWAAPPARPDLGGPIENTLQPLCGAAFRTTLSLRLPAV